MVRIAAALTNSASRTRARSEIEAATPYNTYVIEGLPPGPIANPGRAALEAVANAGPRGLTEILYAYSSATGNNGSACNTVGDPPGIYEATFSTGAISGVTNALQGFSSRGPVSS